MSGEPADESITGSARRRKFPAQEMHEFLEIAWALNKAEDHASAVECLTEAIQLFSTKEGTSAEGMACLYWARGLMSATMGSFKNAIQDLLEAMRMDPTCKRDSELYYAMGMAFRALRNDWMAVRSLSEAIRLRPDSAMYYLARAKANLRCREPEDAMKDLQQVTSLAPATEGLDELRGRIMAARRRERYVNSTIASVGRIFGEADCPWCEKGPVKFTPDQMRTGQPVVCPHCGQLF
jgi:tetratricopeptide (TPR) repeat protein